MLLDVVLVPVLLSVLLMLLMLLMKSRRRGMVMVMLIALVMMITTAVANGALLLFTLTACLFVDLLDGPQFFLEFHAAILEPDFDLALCQTECVGDFNSPPPSQVVIEVEFLLQFQSLVARVRLATSSPWTSIGSFILC